MSRHHYIPLSTLDDQQQSPNQLDSLSTDHYEAPLTHSHDKSLGATFHYRGRHIVFWLSAAVFFLSIPLQIYFGFPSTFHIYLVSVFLLPPIFLALTLSSLLGSHRDGSSLGNPYSLYFRLVCLIIAITWVIWACLTPSPSRSLPTNSNQIAPNTTVFFAINLHNSQDLFPKYSDALEQVVSALGNQNVFISIYESHSKDQTKALLKQFDQRLSSQAIPHRILMDDAEKKVGKEFEDVDHMQQRIHYLSQVRNKALDPISKGLNGKPFDQVVWINDVFYQPESLLSLIQSVGAGNDLVCAFDFIPLGFYDTWVTLDRDANGVKPLWPYFSRKDDIDALRQGNLIPVDSCWNGIAAFDGKWFQGPQPSNSRLAQSGTTSVLPPTEANSSIIPLHFHGYKQCPLSECLLASHDIHLAKAPERPKIYMNPRVVATYEWSNYIMYNHLLRLRIADPWLVVWQDWIGHRIFGWVSEIGRRKDACFDNLKPGWAKEAR